MKIQDFRPLPDCLVEFGAITLSEAGGIPMSKAHQEKIICPSCKAIRLATVVHTRPFYSYVHECECGYIITESDWEKANEGEDEEHPYKGLKPEDRFFQCNNCLALLRDTKCECPEQHWLPSHWDYSLITDRYICPHCNLIIKVGEIHECQELPSGEAECDGWAYLLAGVVLGMIVTAILN